ncbi:MAG: lysophospholipid acyltransferase family protein [Thermodesulfobacteriota bacterium]
MSVIRRKRKKSPLRKAVENHLGYLLFKILIGWVRLLPLNSLSFYGEKIGLLVYSLYGKRRKIALNNLSLVLGKEKTSEEIEHICRETFKNIGKDMIEMGRCLDYDAVYLKNTIQLEGKEYLDQALTLGKGVIALSAHFGNFPLMCVRLVKEGYPFSLVARDPENPRLARFIASARERIGMESIPDKPRMTCVSRCLTALKQNRVLFIQIDQNAPATEAWVDFFGYLVPTFKGPIIFSLRTGAPILPMFILRESDQLHRILIHPPYELKLTGNTAQDVLENIGHLTKIVESVIQKHPEHWWWIHKRFKRAKNIPPN